MRRVVDHAAKEWTGNSLFTSLLATCVLCSSIATTTDAQDRQSILELPPASVFHVPAPTGDPVTDLDGIQSTLSRAQAWQAIQPIGRDGLPPKVEVLLAAGTYRICNAGVAPPGNPGGAYCIELANWKNLRLSGSGSATTLLLLTPQAGAIDVYMSSHITISDLRLDYLTPPFTQGVIRAVNTASNGYTLQSIDVQISPGYQTFADPLYRIVNPQNFLIIMDPTKPEVKHNVPDFMRISHSPAPYLLPNGRWRLTVAASRSPNWTYLNSAAPIKPGDRFVYVTRFPNRATEVRSSDTVTFARLTIYASPGIATAFLEDAGPLTLDHINIQIPPGSSRLISTNADGAHFQNDRGPITISHCIFQNMADDAINIYSVLLHLQQVLSTGANGQLIAYAQRAIVVGDQLQILNGLTGAIRGVGDVTHVVPMPCPEGSVARFCATVTLDRLPAAAAAQDVLYLYNAAGTGTRILNNIFHNFRGSGIKLNSPHSLVAGNVFSGLTGSHIWIGGIVNEGPVPDQVQVENNLFIGSDTQVDRPTNGVWQGVAAGYSAQIAVTSVLPISRSPFQITAVQGPSHIQIIGNSFFYPETPSIYIGAGNTIDLSEDHVVSNDTIRRMPGPAVLFAAGGDFVVNHLSLLDVGPGTTAAIEIGCGVSPAPTTSSWTIWSPNVTSVLDDNCPDRIRRAHSAFAGRQVR